MNSTFAKSPGVQRLLVVSLRITPDAARHVALDTQRNEKSVGDITASS